jgi:hypothetical protein
MILAELIDHMAKAYIVSLDLDNILIMDSASSRLYKIQYNLITHTFISNTLSRYDSVCT